MLVIITIMKLSKRIKKNFISLTALLTAFTLCLCGCKPQSTEENKGESPDVDELLMRESETLNPYASTTRVGASYEYLGTAERNKPVEGISDGGLKTAGGESAYPVYGRTKSLTEAERSAVIAENDSLCAYSSLYAAGSYDKMDEDGYLYRNGEPVTDASGTRRRLFKHTGSVGLYGGDVSDSEKGVIKRMTFSRRSYSGYYNVTGLYAPAGEVIKVEIPEADMEATGGIFIHIGQALYNAQPNNIWAQREFNRMPIILNTMPVTKQTAELNNGVYTAYIGSYLGGPIYVRDEAATFSVTMSGAVNYEHLILGVTTEEEFNELRKSSAPYFDLEVWESGVLHSGPRSGASAFSYEELVKAATLWEKISLVSTKITDQGIVFLYDCFVAAGAAVAFPGRRSVNCPIGWMTGSLDYNTFVNIGTWGNLHEYHHNFQSGWGFGYTGEVTNNALNLVSYSLFTKVSAQRSIGNYGASGLTSWNTYTSATWALNRVNRNEIGSTNGLAVYATLLHNLGQDAFIKSKASGVNYLNKWAEVTHQDFGYYAGLVESYSGVSPSSLTSTNYPAFVPVSCAYQTGRSYMYDGTKRYIQTMQPYTVPYGEDLTVDLRPYKTNASGQYESGSIVIGNGLSYTIKKVDTSALNGSLVPTETKDVYTYRMGSSPKSGKIIVTIGITDDNNVLGGKRADDVDLVLEFNHSHEPNKFILNRTVYSYADGTQPTSAAEAFESNYAGSTQKTEFDNVNFTQDSNTDVWQCEASNRPANALDWDVREPNSVIEVSGKIKFSQSGKYRLVLRGRWNAALFVSLDGGKTFMRKAELLKPASNTSANFSYADEKLYCDVSTDEITDPDGYVYFKSVLVTACASGKTSFVGLGYAPWTGDEAPADASKVKYVTAYRNDYVPDEEFESDYFYKKEYNYSYRDSDAEYGGENQTLVSSDCVDGWGQKGVGANGNYGISKMFDKKADTSYISQWWDVSENKPLSIVAKLDAPVTANYVNIVGAHANMEGGNWHMPLKFSFYGSLDGENWELYCSADEPELVSKNMFYAFNGEKTFGYYKLVVYRTSDGASGRVGINRIGFMKRSYEVALAGGNNNLKSPDDPMLHYRGDWDWSPSLSTFGHINLGKKDATVDFEFEGTRFAILSSQKFGNDYEVYIDGVKADSFTVKKSDEDYRVNYLSPELSSGKHKIVIRCLGEANIGSIALFT